MTNFVRQLTCTWIKPNSVWNYIASQFNPALIFFSLKYISFSSFGTIFYWLFSFLFFYFINLLCFFFLILVTATAFTLVCIFCIYCTVSNSIKHLKINSLQTIILLFCSAMALSVLFWTLIYMKGHAILGTKYWRVLTQCHNVVYNFKIHICKTSYRVPFPCPNCHTCITVWMPRSLPYGPASRGKFLIRPLVLGMEWPQQVCFCIVIIQKWYLLFPNTAAQSKRLETGQNNRKRDNVRTY